MSTYSVVVIETVRSVVTVTAPDQKQARWKVLSAALPAGVMKRRIQNVEQVGVPR